MHPSSSLSPYNLLLFLLGTLVANPTVVAFSSHVTIDYCVGCRWGLRSVWMAQELLTKHPHVTQVTLQPSDIAGTFIMRQTNKNQELWDRKEQGGFPELDDVWDALREADKEPPNHNDNEMVDVATPNVEICFTPSTLLRAAYLGQELLTTFDEFEIRSVTLSSSNEFSIALDGTLLFDGNHFPATKVLKQKVRDALVPDKDLGHSDHKPSQSNETKDTIETMDDDEAEDARRYFGVA